MPGTEPRGQERGRDPESHRKAGTEAGGDTRRLSSPPSTPHKPPNEAKTALLRLPRSRGGTPAILCNLPADPPPVAASYLGPRAATAPPTPTGPRYLRGAPPTPSSSPRSLPLTVAAGPEGTAVATPRARWPRAACHAGGHRFEVSPGVVPPVPGVYIADTTAIIFRA